MYTASSVKRALENVTAGKGYCFEKLEQLGCPTVNDASRKCCGDYKNCYDAHYKICRQRVHVCRNDNRRFKRILNFYFTVSDTDNDGFIDEKDTLLRWLINELSVINESDLVRVPRGKD